MLDGSCRGADAVAIGCVPVQGTRGRWGQWDNATKMLERPPERRALRTVGVDALPTEGAVTLLAATTSMASRFSAVKAATEIRPKLTGGPLRASEVVAGHVLDADRPPI